MSEHLVCITLDFDTVSLWLAMGQTSPTPISRGEFGVVAAGRLLDLFERHDITTTWFVPGITIDSFESACRGIVERQYYMYILILPQNNLPVYKNSSKLLVITIINIVT